MEWLASYWWFVVLALLFLVIVLFRRGGFHFGAKGAGFGIKVVGKAASTHPPVANKPSAPGTSAHASGDGAVAIGRDANSAKITTGGRKA